MSISVIIVLLIFTSAAYSQNTWSVAAGGGKSDEGQVIQPTADGGAIAAGGSGGGFVVKVNSAGNLQWMKKTNLGQIQSIIKRKDGYILSDRGRVIKLNLQGDLVWGTRYNDDVVMTPLLKINGGYLFAASLDGTSNFSKSGTVEKSSGPDTTSPKVAHAETI